MKAWKISFGCFLFLLACWGLSLTVWFLDFHHGTDGKTTILRIAEGWKDGPEIEITRENIIDLVKERYGPDALWESYIDQNGQEAYFPVEKTMAWFTCEEDLRNSAEIRYFLEMMLISLILIGMHLGWILLGYKSVELIRS